jgi:hypothetical protein
MRRDRSLSPKPTSIGRVAAIRRRRERLVLGQPVQVSLQDDALRIERL